VREHILAGGRAIVLEEGMGGHMITLYDNGTHIPLLWTHLIPATLDGRALHNVQNAMFAASIAFSMGIKLDEIRHGLRTFDMTYFQAPGRMNICDEHPFKVILDYGHNPAAVLAMVELVERLEPEGKRVLVVAAPGDRRDEDIAEIASHCAGKFDRYICRRDDNTRGRDSDEVPRLQRQALIAGGVDPEAIEIIPDEVEALERALSWGESGDLLLIFGDEIQRCWKQITTFQSGQDPVDTTRASSGPPLPKRLLVDSAAPGLEEELVRDERGVRLARPQEPGD
jgi:cyanophycin synthetase